ncbi:EI24 domain-containing protein [Planktothrix mougeotii]|uniref:EI24 domain-containing protein n=1 Tax=Planktothrix mougeotii LEGE 06226 TaxID=1828728 RepID=A0ABR9U5Y8_9CYAN|nr:EI24 domain-containing protein [Planktothrix mougeotii]MBE9141863.1 EI24 domain-containing protein [Planktothrix mougeotii LEGE 06226]
MNSNPLQPQNPLLDTPLSLITGATYPLKALKLFYHNPPLRGYIILPVIVNIIVGISLYFGLVLPGLNQIDKTVLILGTQIDEWVANLPQWLHYLDILANILGWLLRVGLVTGLLFIIGFLLLQFGGILGAPWYGQLSEKVEELQTGQPAVLPPQTLTSSIQDIGRAILYELKKIGLQILIGFPLLLLNFIPGFGTLLFTIGGIALASTIVCLDFLDSPMERRRFRFRDKLKMILRTFPASGSFALVCFGLVVIPLLNLLAIPVCIAAGTMFFCDRILLKYDSDPEKINRI